MGQGSPTTWMVDWIDIQTLHTYMDTVDNFIYLCTSPYSSDPTVVTHHDAEHHFGRQSRLPNAVQGYHLVDGALYTLHFTVSFLILSQPSPWTLQFLW